MSLWVWPIVKLWALWEADLVGGISKYWCHFRARNRGNIFLASIIEFFSIFDFANDKVVSLWGGGGHMVITSFCALVVAMSHASTLQVTYLQLSCNWMFELLATEVSTC